MYQLNHINHASQCVLSCQLRHTSTISATVMLMISPGEKIPQCGTELGGIIVILVLTVSRIAYRTIK